MMGLNNRNDVLKTMGVFLCLFFSFQVVLAQMHPVAKESSIVFSIHNFGFKTGGKLEAPKGDIVFNPEDLSKSSFQITVQAESINTDNDSRDEHLRQEEYFDVKKYPQIRFVSSSVRAVNNKGNFQMDGTLTIKDVSKPISLSFKAEKTNSGYRFTGSFKMNRKDFNVGGSSTISNELTVDILVVAQ
jgi:polyisoprenoid-binding protein YceI